MKKLHAIAQPAGRLPKLLALLLMTAAICISCGSDSTDLPTPEEEGGGNPPLPEQPDRLPDIAAYKVADVVEAGFEGTLRSLAAASRPTTTCNSPRVPTLP